MGKGGSAQNEYERLLKRFAKLYEKSLGEARRTVTQEAAKRGIRPVAFLKRFFEIYSGKDNPRTIMNRMLKREALKIEAYEAHDVVLDEIAATKYAIKKGISVPKALELFLLDDKLHDEMISQITRKVSDNGQQADDLH